MRDTKLASSGAGLPRISWWRSVELVEPLEQQRQPVGGRDRGEERVHPGLERLVLEQARAERVEGGHVELLVGRLDQRLEALAHLGRGRRGEGEREDRVGGHALLHEPGEAARERARLSGARAGHHEQRPLGMGHGRELGAVEAVERGRASSLGYAAPEPAGLIRTRPWAQAVRGATETSRLLGSRHRPPPARQGLRVLRRGRRPDHRAVACSSGSRELAIPPAWEDVWVCPYPMGHIQATGVGRRRAQAVPLPRPLARAPRPREVRVDGGVRPRAAAAAPARREATSRTRGHAARARRWPAPPACSTAASSASAPRTTPRRTTPTASPRCRSAT